MAPWQHSKNPTYSVDVSLCECHEDNLYTGSTGVLSEPHAVILPNCKKNPRREAEW